MQGKYTKNLECNSLRYTSKSVESLVECYPIMWTLYCLSLCNLSEDNSTVTFLRSILEFLKILT